MDRFKFLFGYIKQHKVSYSAGIIFIILTNYISITIPEYLRLSIDLLSKGLEELEQHQADLFRYLGIMLALAASIILIRSLSRIFFFNPGRAIEYKIKNDMFHKLMLLRKNYHENNPTGTVISRIQNDISGVRVICGFGTMQIFNILSAVSLTPYKMWQLSPTLTLYCIIPIVIVFITIRMGMHYIVKYTHSRMVKLQEISNFIVSSLSGIDIIKHYSLSKWVRGEFNSYNSDLFDQSLKISYARSFLMPVLHNLENILKVLILLIGGLYVIQQDFTIGELTAFIAYAALLVMPINGLGWLTTILQQGLVGVSSIQSVMSQEVPRKDTKDLPKPKLKSLFEQGLECKNLTFAYGETAEPVLKTINFKIMPNQTVGILGQVGSGKTTLVNCLNGYLDINDNQVFLGDTDINTMSYSDLSSVIRTVSQDIFLFSDTVDQNINFGCRDEGELSKQVMEDIVTESALKEEVERFPKAMETIVGEKGIMLSGGQKQRISLARAMAEDCDLLILDNVLSAVDYETERFLLKYILQRKRSKSLLIISHRVQALEDADQILVFDHGTIVDQGTHEELIQRPGLYQSTWKLQNKKSEKLQA